MKKNVWPSAIRGCIAAPPSKSVAQRAIAMASLANGLSIIDAAGNSEDVVTTINICKTLGADIKKKQDKLFIRGGIKVPAKVLDCGESGLAIRMFSCIAATLDSEITLTGKGSLKTRPLQSIEDTLVILGADCKTNNGRLPVTIKGPLPGGKAMIDASLSSQVLTGVLAASPLAKKDTCLYVNNLVSKPYIDLTIDIMRSFGVEAMNHDYENFFIKCGQVYKPVKMVIEGDWSAAAFWLVAGATGGSIHVKNLKKNTFQADRMILQALISAGAIVEHTDEGIKTSKQALRAFEFDATHCPDLFPPLVVLAANCTGESRLHGVERLYTKESDRAMILKKIFTKLGIRIYTKGNTMIVKGGHMNTAAVSSHGDHRMAMAAAIAALNARGTVTILEANAVNKSYPGFFGDLNKITSS